MFVVVVALVVVVLINVLLLLLLLVVVIAVVVFTQQQQTAFLANEYSSSIFGTTIPRFRVIYLYRSSVNKANSSTGVAECLLVDETHSLYATQ